MIIKIVADLVCPWCYLGILRLKRALSYRPGLSYRFVWHSFLLNPDAPPGGIPLPYYLSSKAGGDPGRLVGGVLKAAAADGVTLDLSRIAILPNSFDAHRLVKWAARHPGGEDDHARLIDALFEAYFAEGDDIGRQEVLVAVAQRVGFEPEPVRRLLAGDEERDAVRMEHQQARALGIRGVPCFIIDGRYAISGAQEPEVFLPLLDIGRVNEFA